MAEFEYDETVHVESVKPSSGGVMGGTRITITGRGFNADEGFCKFVGREDVTTRIVSVLSSNLVICVAPSSSEAGTVTVEVSTNEGLSYSGDGVQYTYYNEPFLTHVMPSHAAVTGGSSITFVGGNFADSSDLSCRFGMKSVTRSLRPSVSMVVCTSPASNPGNVSIEISNNGQDFTKTGLRFSFREALTFGLVPSRGPVVGGTVVTITGLEASGSDLRRITFGSTFVAVETADDGSSTVVVPVGSFPGLVSVTVDEYGTAVQYEYLSVPFVSAIRPTLGFVSRSSVVTMVGTNFEVGTDYVIQAGEPDVLVPGSLVSSSLLLARVPCLTAGAFSIDVVDVLSQEVTRAHSKYECARSLQVFELSPSFGQTQGGDLVHVLGAHFIDSQDLSCRFGLRSIVPATYKTSTKIACFSPSRSRGNVTVELSIDSIDFTTSGVQYSYFSTTIHQVFPSLGPVRGGTSVTITASHFPSDGFDCVFAVDNVPAIRISDTSAVCISPPSEAGTVVLEVADVKMQNLRFRYEEDASVDYIYPSVGSRLGGDIIKAVGKGFTPEIVSFVAGRHTESKWVSSSLLLLKSPPAKESGDVSIEVTNFLATGNSTFDRFTYRYEDPLMISSIYPSLLPISGSRLVTIIGTNFVPTWKYVCQFGSMPQQEAIYATSSEIHCHAPAAPAGNVTLRVGYSAGALMPTGLVVSFQMQSLVDDIYPLISSKSGGTVVTIQGRDFNTAREATCFFGRVGIPASIVSEREMTCEVPSSRDRSVQMNVLIDGALVSQPGVNITYNEDPRISKLIPSTGPVEGNTPVSVFGSNFQGDNMFCVLSDGSKFSAVSVTNTVLKCVTPPAELGVYTIHVEIDGYHSLTAAEYEYESALIADMLVPSVGPVEGGTVVTVFGQGFQSSKGVMCKFGDYLVMRGEWISETSVGCITPESDVGNRTLEVSVNGVDFSLDARVFTFMSRLSIMGISPSLGPVEGGTSVTFTGWGLDRYEDLHCRFGTSVLPIVEATETSIVCHTPSHAVGLVSVSVTNFAHSATLEVPFSFVPSAILLGLEPSFTHTSGGTLVTVIGANFLESSVCKFGHRHSECGYLSSSSLKCYAPSHQISEVFVEMSNNGIDYTDSKVSFAYIEQARIITLEPSVAPTSGATTVTVHGENFYQGRSLQCRFGSNRASRGRFVSGNQIRCTTPRSAPANVTFSITMNGEEYLDSGLSFIFREHVSVTELHPTLGPVSGNTHVTVYGSFENVPYTCKFGYNLVPARFLTHTTRSCRSPSGREGLTAVEISTNQIDWTKNRKKFYYHPRQTLTSFLPSTGTLEGQTLVQVFGSNFQNAPLHCKFGSQIVKGSVVDSNLALCNAPVRQASGSVSFEITQNSQDYSDSGLVYLYHDIIINHFDPPGGPSTGGTQVHISGSGFLNLNTLRCKFSDTVVVAVWISQEEIWCTSPEGHEGEADLEVSNNNADWSTQGTKFDYYTKTTVHRLAPSIGVNAGNTQVTVFGTNFVNSTSLVCRFGVTVVPVLHFLSPSRLICNSVPYDNTKVAVEVSNNKRDFTANGVEYLYSESPVIKTLLPSSGPTTGQSIVTLVGDHFRHSTDLRCKFGSVLAFGKWLTPSLITCRTPYGMTGIVTVEVSNNAVDFSFSDSQYLYYEQLEIKRISPSVGPSTRGGTIVTVEGSGVRNAFGLSCRFGFVVVPAHFISETLFQCRTPSSSPGLTTFEASSNRMDFTKSGKTFMFQAEITIRTLLPNFGLDVGDTPVFLTGSNFFNSTALSCRFGAKIVKAVFLSQDTIFCLSPPQPPGSVDVAASNNGIEYTTERLLFHYRVCPIGSFCIGGEIVTCPAGAYCPANGLYNFTLCAPGLYQDKTGQNKCKRCTIGSICPDFGMPFPQDCPPGYVCDRTGLVVPSKPCPPGHYCFSGTKTSNAKDVNVKKRPLPCPQGFYCVAGAVTSVSILLNFTTPQPCFPGYYCSPGSETPHGQGPCPSGFHCPQYSPGMVKACPPGTFCPRVGNVEPLPCKPGTYNENYAQSICNICPLGRMCPTFGLLTPRMCPAGYVCDETGKATWSKLCPAGFWCGEGTLTSNASSALQPKPNPCAPGTYCLMGVKTNRTVPGRLDTAQICVEGTYCETATGSPQGTAPCPRGYFCGSGVSEPVAARPGFYVSRPGSVIQVPCTPGTFTATSATVQCMDCPSGHSCADDGTITPAPCAAGTYRSITDSVSCVYCPTGTWSTRKGLTDSSLCEPCPPGVVCSVAGMTTLNISSPCPEGYVCGPRTNSENQFDIKCPPGYVCSFGTTPSTQYDMLCEAGFGCPEGTSFNTRNLMPCSPGYYCPEGSTSAYPLITKCPIGTTSDEGAKSEYDCYRNQVESICRVSPYYSNSTFDADLSYCMLKWTCWKTTPEDEEAQALCVTKQLLAARYNFDENLQNPTLKSEPTQWQYIEAFGVAKISLDFRSIPEELTYEDHYEIALYFYNKTQPIRIHKQYGRNGGQSNKGGCEYFTPSEQIFKNEPVCVEFDGTWFGSKNVDKRGLLEFSISAHTELYFRVEIEIFHGRFIGNKNFTSFKRTMTVEKFYPSRADYKELNEDCSVYDVDTSNSTCCAGAAPESANRRAVTQQQCVVQRDESGYSGVGAQSRDCSKQFLIALDSSNVELNVALNVEAPFESSEFDEDTGQGWNFQTLPWIDFITTNSSIPLEPQPFVSAGNIKGVGMKNDIAYPRVQKIWRSNGLDENGQNAMVGTGDSDLIMLPYLPFFSACKGWDSHMYLFRVLESRELGSPGDEISKDGQGCKLQPSCLTRPINPYLGMFPSESPTEEELVGPSPPQDYCDWRFQCTYEEQIEKTAVPKRWFSQPEGSVLFYITLDAYNMLEYRDLKKFKSMRSTKKLTKASVQYPMAVDPLLVAVGVPGEVKLNIQFFQVTKFRKQVIKVFVELDRFREIKNESNPEERAYTLSVQYHGLAWFDCLNNFAFNIEVYLTLFVIAGSVSVLFAAVFWAFHRLMTRLSSPPAFRFGSYFALTVLPPTAGFIFVIIPLFFIVGFMNVFFLRNQLSWPFLTRESKVFGAMGNPYSAGEEQEEWDFVQQGRFAVALFTVGCYVMHQSARLMVPRKEATDVEEVTTTEDSETKIWTPALWHQTHIILSNFITVMVCLILFEYSFSSVFANNIYSSLLILLLFRLFYSSFLEEILGEVLIVVPHEIVIDLVVGMATMGAASLIDFLQGFFLDSFLGIAQRVYIDPGIGSVMEKIDWVIRIYEKYRAQQEALRDEEADDDMDAGLWGDEDEEEIKSPVEDIIGSYVSYSGEAITNLFSPFTILFVMWTEPVMKLGEKYSILTTDFQYFYMFAFVMIPFLMVKDLFLHNVTELYHGWKVYDYMKYCKHRYSKRQFRWKAADPNEDESINEGLRSLDLLCFSSQYYFIMCVATTGLGLTTMAIEGLLRQQDHVKTKPPYNPFEDKMLPFVIALTFAFMKVSKFLPVALPDCSFT